MLKKPGKISGESIQAQKPALDVKSKKGDGSGRVVAPDEFIKKASKPVGEFTNRFMSGLRYLNEAYMDEVAEKVRSEENWETAFKDVISDILEKSGLNHESVIEFAFKQYKKFLSENPREKERVKEYISKKSKELKDKNSKKVS